MDIYPRLRKCLIVGIILLFLGASTTFDVNASCINPQLPRVVYQHVQAIQQEVVGQPGSMGNVKVSPGAGNDVRPRMTTNAAGDIIIVYEQKEDIFTTTVPVVYSVDGGYTWTQQFLFNSLDYHGSGILSAPDIIYNPSQDILWFNVVDPNVEMYNEMHFIPGDIANATETIGFVTGAGSNAMYSEAACTHTNDYFLSFTTEGYGGDLEQIFGSEWYCYPDYTIPPGIGGFYFDGQSLIRIAPVAESEADYNTNRWFLVAESEAIVGGTQIVIKSGTTNKTLINNGEQQNHMDKYGDIEQAPGEFLGQGTNPDVSGSSSNVAVVFARDGTILCSVSSCVATYEPEFHWQTTMVEAGGASNPAVYMQGDIISVAYVKNGNLYYKVSEDGGASWEDVQQKNDVNGTVVAQKGSVDICKQGIAFVDNRNGNNDVYFASAKTPAPELSITVSGHRGMTIKNIGDAPAYNVSWSITVKGGFILLGKSSSGNLPEPLEPGQEITVGSIGFLLGFGVIEITYAVSADNVPRISKTLTGKLLGFFFIGY
jgi:hypothetical protein